MAKPCTAASTHMLVLAVEWSPAHGVPCNAHLEATLERLTVLDESVKAYMNEMGLDPQSSEDGLYLFKYGSTVVMLSMFKSGEDTFCRFVSIVLKDVEPTLELLHRILKLNTEVLFGSFILFDDNTLSFSATVLGNNLDFDEFATTLRYVASISDDYDDVLQDLAGGERAEDFLDVD
jgi:hypothetical protein